MCSLAFLTHDLSSLEKCWHISASPGTKCNDDDQPDTIRETLQVLDQINAYLRSPSEAMILQACEKAGTKLATNSRQAIRVGLRHLMGPWQAARSGREERHSARALDAKAEQLPESRAIRRRAFSSP